MNICEQIYIQKNLILIFLLLNIAREIQIIHTIHNTIETEYFDGAFVGKKIEFFKSFLISG